MTEGPWVQRVDTSALLGVVPIVSSIVNGPILVEFISVEVRAFGAVLTLRIVDAGATESTPFAVIPRVTAASEDQLSIECLVVSNDFNTNQSIRHRVVVRPQLTPDTWVSFSVDGFEFDERNLSASGPWPSPRVQIPRLVV